MNDIREWVTMFRRLFTPGFEEGRRHFNEAKHDGLFAEANEIWPYLPDTLEQVVAEYGEEEE